MSLESAGVALCANRHNVTPSTARRAVHAPWVRCAQALIDFIAFTLAPCAAAGILLAMHGDLSPYFPQRSVAILAVVYFALSAGCIGWFWVRLRHYTYRKTYWAELGEILRTVALCAVIQLVVIALLKIELSRNAWLLTWGGALVLVPMARFGFKRILMRARLWHKACVIIGTGPNALETYQALRQEESLGFDFRFFYACDDGVVEQIHGVPVIRDEAMLWAHTDPTDTHYFIATETGNEAQRDRWIRLTAMHHCRAVSVVPTTRGLPLNSIDASFLFSRDVLILRINENLRRRSARTFKRAFDIAASLALLTVLSPLFVYLLVRIRRDGGQPIYGHERIGRDGRAFKCLKFRSMVLNSQQVLAELLATDPVAQAEWNADFKLKNDPRITMIGQFLRRSSLDELPQLWNVLRGDMSLVGPRPVVTEELSRYGENADYYLMAKPGMTGLWQISGRNDVDYDTRVYFDAWYIKNWSLWHDIAILFKTIRVVLGKSGAY